MIYPDAQCFIMHISFSTGSKYCWQNAHMASPMIVGFSIKEIIIRNQFTEFLLSQVYNEFHVKTYKPLTCVRDFFQFNYFSTIKTINTWINAGFINRCSDRCSSQHDRYSRRFSSGQFIWKEKKTKNYLVSKYSFIRNVFA